jgi:hypothetical protein
VRWNSVFRGHCRSCRGDFGGEEAMSGDGQPAPAPGQEVAEFLGLCSVLRLSNE